MEHITLGKLKTKQKTFRFGACPKSSNVSNSYNIFSLIVILFINFLTKVSMYE